MNLLLVRNSELSFHIFATVNQKKKSSQAFRSDREGLPLRKEFLPVSPEGKVAVCQESKNGIL